jgi:hypothetical protein
MANNGFSVTDMQGIAESKAMNAYNKNWQKESFPPKQEADGWDPYEVWRTRVLLPRAQRLEESREDAAPKQVAPKILAA